MWDLRGPVVLPAVSLTPVHWNGSASRTRRALRPPIIILGYQGKGALPLPEEPYYPDGPGSKFRDVGMVW